MYVHVLAVHAPKLERTFQLICTPDSRLAHYAQEASIGETPGIRCCGVDYGHADLRDTALANERIEVVRYRVGMCCRSAR